MVKVEEVAYATSSSFFGFCLSRKTRGSAPGDGAELTRLGGPPGGKTRRVRKPPVFIRFDAHVVKAGISLRGCDPLTTPELYGNNKMNGAAVHFVLLFTFLPARP